MRGTSGKTTGRTLRESVSAAMATGNTDEYYLSALWHHLLPHATEYVEHCRDCGTQLTPVPPDELMYLCANCYPRSFDGHL